ncbi:tyrosine-type recombinase/integrase, partial [bacterium]|nr:tyrosine-type recombinase/integrase [bacterium]
MSWIDELGVKRRRSTRVREKAVAQRMLNAVTLEVSQVRAGLLDRAALRRKEVRSQPIEEHLGTYLEVMRSRKLNEHHLKQKGKQLRRFFDHGSIRSLGDITPDRLEAFMGFLGDEGLSARTQNQHRQQVIAFLNWCKETERIESHRLGSVPKRDETRDRRHQRRALTEEELGRLLAVARERGREAWYLCAALAGLRKGDLERLRWSDVDFEGRTLLIRGGKGRAEDRVPLRSELAECLQARYQEQQPEAGGRVFPQTVRDLTRQKDFLRAGLAREEVVLGSDGEPVRT